MKLRGVAQPLSLIRSRTEKSKGRKNVKFSRKNKLRWLVQSRSKSSRTLMLQRRRGNATFR